MISPDALQAIGSFLAILGACFNCSQDTCDKLLGFKTWIASNFILLVFAMALQLWWLAGMYVIFSGTSWYGWLKHRGRY